MGYAFISYSTVHKDEAETVRALLEKNGIDTWMAVYDIPSGSDYAAEIINGIKNCACVVLMLNKAAQESQHVNKELERAVHYNKPIVTLQTESLTLSASLEYYISSVQRSFVQSFDETTSVIKEVLNSIREFTGKGTGKNVTPQKVKQPESKDKEPESSEEDVLYFNENLQRAENGDVVAQCNLGFCYHNGKGVQQNFEEAVKWFTKAALQGDKVAQYNLGICYKHGTGVEKNYETAVKWFIKSAKQGYASGQCALAHCYLNGSGVCKSLKKAVKLYTKAAKQGFAEAQYNLGICYEKGKGVRLSYDQAAKLYKAAAEQDYPEAQLSLGECYEKGQGVTQSYDMAAKWYTKLYDNGYRIRFSLFRYYYDKEQGKIVILSQLHEASEKGDVKAQCKLGAYGKKVLNNYKFAFNYYSKAAEQGNAEAQYEIGMLYYRGDGVEQSEEEAEKWFKKSAEQGYAQAQHMLGVIYGGREGIQYNEEAIKWYKKAAAQGYEMSQVNLGELYYRWRDRYKEYDLPKDYEEVITNYVKAVENGNKTAQLYLYFHCKNLQSEPPLFDLAVQWFKKSAEEGNYFSQCCLGVCYEKGFGVQQSTEEAIKWYKTAAKVHTNDILFGDSFLEERLKALGAN